MVIREPVRQGAENSQMSQQYSNDDDSSSSSSDSFKKGGDNSRKRKTSENNKDLDTKRMKNREAAKRCREKKQKQTEDLQKRNEELEEENTKLVREKQQLVEQCRKFEEEFKQHRHHGCAMPPFESPYDIEDFANPRTPPAPSFSTSPCPSPAPSISPAPQAQNYLAEAACSSPSPVEMHPYVGANVQRMETGGSEVAEVPGSTHSPAPSGSGGFWVKVRDGNGKTRTLQIPADQLRKVLQANKISIQQPAPRKQEMQPTTSMTTLMPSQMVQPVIKTEPVDMPPCEMHNQQIDLTQDHVDSGQKLDSKGWNEVLAIMQGHAQAVNNLTFEPVSEQEVASQIKAEPQDTENQESQSIDIIKQQLMGVSTGSQIRESLNTLNALEPENAIQLLSNDDGSVFIIPTQNQLQMVVPMQAACQQVAKKSVPSAAPSGRQTVTFVMNMQGTGGQTFVTSTAPIGTLKNVSAAANQKMGAMQPAMTSARPSGQPAGQGMQNGQARPKHPPGVQLRVDAISKMSTGQPKVSIQSSASRHVLGGKFINVDTTSRPEERPQINTTNTWNGNSGLAGKQAQGGQMAPVNIRGTLLMPMATKNMPAALILDGQSDVLQAGDSAIEIPISEGQQISTSMNGWDSLEIPEPQTVPTFSTGQIQDYLSCSSIEVLDGAIQLS